MKFADKHPVVAVVLAVVGIYAAVRAYSSWKVGQIVDGQKPQTGSQGVATGEPNSMLTARPRSWDVPGSVPAGGGAIAGPLLDTPVPPWDRQYR